MRRRIWAAALTLAGATLSGGIMAAAPASAQDSPLMGRWRTAAQGGVVEIDKRNQAKADLLYGLIDKSDFYRNGVAIANRSRMNVPFQLKDPALDKFFLEESLAAGLHALKGHRVVGGMRASIYNAMPLEGVKTLTDFMVEFERRHG